MMKRLALVLATVLWAGVASAAPKAPIDYAALNAHVVAKHIVPRYQAFLVQANTLGTALTAYCAAPGDKALSSARDAFHATVDAWQAIEHLRSGPTAELNAAARVNFWPDPKGLGGRHLRQLLGAQDAERLAPARFAQSSIAVQGIPALERLLFSEAGKPLLEVPPADGAVVTPCKAAHAIARNLAAIGGDLVARWSKDPFAGLEAKKATSNLFTDLAGGLEAVADLKVGGPLGEKTGRLWPKRAEDWRSGRALRNIEINILALKDMYAAMADGAGKRLSGTPEDAYIRGEFDAAAAKAKAVGPTLVAALETTDGQARAKALIAAVRELREVVVGNMMAPLDLILGFNSRDGD